MARHTIKELEDAFGFKAIDNDALDALREKETTCYLAPWGNTPDIFMIMCDYNENIDTPEKITCAEFMSIVAKSCSESKVDFPISEEIYERNSKWLNLQPWKRSIVVDGLRLTMTGALKRDKVIDYKKLVNDCNAKSNNAKKLAQTLYNEWLNLGRDKEHLIGIYKAMSVATLSTYELESLTKKRLIMDENGYSLEDCSYDAAVTMESLKSINTECCVKNANALGVLNTYKSKYSISDSVWSVELERLQTLCGTTDIYVIADFIETNFL